jgi:hypothetical protein
MQPQKYSYLIPTLLGTLILSGVLIFWPRSEVSAQCGSQASSCKNCHEVRGQDPVNNDGTGWHQSHAFGDFCYICHAGNNQSTDKDEAHTGMVPPLSDVEAGCQSCHPNDLMERASVYATTLGMEVGTGGTPPTASGGSDESSPSDSNPGPSEFAPAAIVVDTDDIIDYNQRYDETVLGVRTINWGNVVLSFLIAVVAAGGGGFVWHNERKLRGLPLLPIKKKSISSKEAHLSPKLEGYSPEVSALLPKLDELNPVGLHALERILENPEEASDLLHSLSRLDPDLIKRMRSLDRESKAMLLALSGD